MGGLLYKKTYPDILRKYASEHKYFSATVDEIAGLFGVKRCTIHSWVSKYPEFKESYEEVRERISNVVESALFKCAIGYDYEERQIEKEGLEPDSPVIRARVIQKHKPADGNAAKFWLINRKGKEWKEKQVVESDGVLTVYIDKKDQDML